ncbi:Proton/sodium-glutamate symport protein [Chlamydiales bacterium STE3]|nr:Proton/sodium-glutamate symport protein [Chlamydiales bacterium STE3]
MYNELDMCAQHSKSRFFSFNFLLAIAVVLGTCLGWLHIPAAESAAAVISEVFMRLLKLVSLPIIFLSIVSTASSMNNVDEIKFLGKKVLKYTLITTVLSATVALILFWVLDPVRGVENVGVEMNMDSRSYAEYLVQAIPSNAIQPFLENNVIGVMMMAMLLSLASLGLGSENRAHLHSLFSSLFAAVLRIITWIIAIMPLAIGAFIILFIKDLRGGLEVKNLGIYLACVIVANLIQGGLVLPVLLKLKGISPIKLVKAMMPALSIAFFTKSSNAALPLAMKCAEERAKIPRTIAGFSFPLCTTINMNGCAAFILITVLFVAMSNGMTFSPMEMIGFLFISVVTAVGNAGVPMGCYFLSSAILAAMNVPLNILGVILPFYAFIDMLETAINVWSDSCVTAVVHKEVTENAGYGISNRAEAISTSSA